MSNPNPHTVNRRRQILPEMQTLAEILGNEVHIKCTESYTIEELELAKLSNQGLCDVAYSNRYDRKDRQACTDELNRRQDKGSRWRD